MRLLKHREQDKFTIAPAYILQHIINEIPSIGVGILNKTKNMVSGMCNIADILISYY